MATSKATREAFVTLATSDAYATGALLASSLKKVATTRKLVILITKGVTASMKTLLEQDFDLVKVVDVFDSEDTVNLQLLKRPELGVTFTKLHCWRLTQFTKAVFMDADTLVMENIDELFEREEISAVRDPGWPDCFNSGVFVFTPSDDTYTSLMQHAITTGSYDGGDQGLLNSYFSNWGFTDMFRHLPYAYNCCSVTFYSYLPALKQFADKVKVVHFIGADKPWSREVPQGGAVRDAVTGLPNFHQYWWNHYRESIAHKLQGLNLNLHTGGHVTSPHHYTTSHHATGTSSHTTSGSTPTDRQQDWETGHIDYRGASRSDNIMAKIKSSVGPSDTSSTFPPPTSTSTPPHGGEDKKSSASPSVMKKK